MMCSFPCGDKVLLCFVFALLRIFYQTYLLVYTNNNTCRQYRRELRACFSLERDVLFLLILDNPCGDHGFDLRSSHSCA